MTDEQPKKSDQRKLLPPQRSRPPDEGRNDTPFAGHGLQEMGKMGGPTPPAPVSPLLGMGSAQSAVNPAPTTDPGDVADHVYIPAPTSNPVVDALKFARLYLGLRDDGAHSVTCHKAAGHPPGVSAEAVYFEPTITHPYGRYICRSDAEKVGIEDLLDHLGITLAEARGKPRIRLIRGETHLAVAAAERVLAQGPYFRSNGSIVRISEDSEGRVTMQRLNDHALSAILASSIHWDQKYKESWVHCDPPRQVIQQLLFGHDLPHIRRLEGVAHQPFLRPDGTLVTCPGYDPETGIYGAFNAGEYDFGPPTEETARRSLAYLQSLIAEYPFPTDADQSAAISLFGTATIRPTLPQAPAISVTAPASGSGKGHLVKLASLFASPSPPRTVSYPTTAEEATKLMPAIFAEKPPVIVFDDMQDDWLPHGAMNMALTSPTITGRVLGESRMATVRTNALIMGTGNDIEPKGDMRRRVVSIRLEPEDDTPALRRFHSDPVGEVRKNRPRAVMAALEIIRAYQAAGKPITDVPPIGTYEEWSTWCRQPLLWLGLPDPATSLIKQVNHDADQEARKHLLIVLYDRIDSDPILVPDIIKLAAKDDYLMDALAQLPVMTGNNVNAKKLGWYFRTKCRRPVGGLKVEPCDAPRQRRAWRIVQLRGASAQAVAGADWPDEMGEMGDRRFRRFSDEDDAPPRWPRKRAYGAR